MKKTNFIAYVMCAFLVVGCGNYTGNGALLGTAGGAGLGALVGQIIGHNTKSTVIGAAVGTAVGATAGTLIGKHMDKVKSKAAAVENAQVSLRNRKIRPECKFKKLCTAACQLAEVGA